MKSRTDIISEKNEIKQNCLIKDKFKRINFGFSKIESMCIDDRETSKKLNIPIGKYFTVSFVDPEIKADHEDIILSVKYCLKKLFDFDYKRILITGLGNRKITPDALGPLTAEKIISTETDNALNSLSKDPRFKIINVIAPGVFADTGIDIYELVYALNNQKQYDAVLIIDALATQKTEKICKTIQLSNCGIVPGSGVYGNRIALNKENLGIPVISIGIPTITETTENRTGSNCEKLMVTPQRIDNLITQCSLLLSNAINSFFNPLFE